MNNIINISKGTSLDAVTLRTVIEVLLPKNWFLNDYDPKENLIEIEDESNGERFWVGVNALFRFWGPLEVGCKRKVVDLDSVMFDAYLAGFDGEIRRKRCYLKAIFLPFGEPEKVDRSTFYFKLKDIAYEGLYVQAIPEISAEETPESDVDLLFGRNYHYENETH
jgi:hypothetical protein